METHDEHLPASVYAEHLERFPEACLELVLETDAGYLLARRTTPPAEGEWFWPGSRLYKGETFPEAVDRIAASELGIGVDIERQLGAHAHFWEEAPFEGVSSRHTVNVVYHVTPSDRTAVDEISLDDQHDGYRFVTAVEDDFHPYVERYFRVHDLLDAQRRDTG